MEQELFLMSTVVSLHSVHRAQESMDEECIWRTQFIFTLLSYCSSLTKKYSSSSLFAYKVRGYPLWENRAAFQALQLCSSPTCEQKRFVWPCSKLLCLCLSCKELLVSSTFAANWRRNLYSYPHQTTAYCDSTVYLAKSVWRTTIPEWLLEWPVFEVVW